ncbi:MAG TPA: hypothetical protein VMF89_09525 [Polyangiales bacterium]|nr:hypothetical protein [Polyangiales bacterium]
MWPIKVRIAAVLLVCGCASSQPPAASSPTAGSSTMQAVSKRFALVGSDGVLVEVVDFAGGESLIRISGSEGPLKNKAVLHTRSEEGEDLRYVTQWSGRDWLTLLRSGHQAYMGTYWRLAMPGREPMQVAYSDDRGEKVDADKLWAAHQEQLRAGELEHIQKLDQSKERREEEEVVERSAQGASRECGSTLRASIAWETVSDQALRERSVSDWCASALRAMNSACVATPEVRSFVQQQIKEVSCRYDGKGEMSLDAGRLTWSMNLNVEDVDTVAGRAFTNIYLPEDGATASNGSPGGSR